MNFYKKSFQDWSDKKKENFWIIQIFKVYFNFNSDLILMQFNLFQSEKMAQRKINANFFRQYISIWDRDIIEQYMRSTYNWREGKVRF